MDKGKLSVDFEGCLPQSDTTFTIDRSFDILFLGLINTSIY